MNESSTDACPLPLGKYERILMGHGGGGMLMQQLLDRVIQPCFDNPYLAARHDSAVFESSGQRFAFTTDSYVVKPLFFPGGDIGKLAVCGTLNDLAMAGASPLFMSAALIIEEGFPITDLQQVLESMAATARAAGVMIVTGDTKVVERGRGDGIYINTAGLGHIDPTLPTIHPTAVLPGDAVLINGDLGRHGIAIMAQREELSLETTIESDCADLSGLVQLLIREGLEIHCLRDLTRGGFGSALIEIAEAARLGFSLNEPSIPVREDVLAVCEILGFDPLYVANEGRMLLILPENQADTALAIMKTHPLGELAVKVGQATAMPGIGQVYLRTAFGTERILTRLSGEQLPRIC